MQPRQVQTMAAYNRWMNERLYEVCAQMTDAERKQDRKAFFRSIHGTLNHLLIGDKIWMSRFAGTVFSISSLDQELFSDFEELRNARLETDREIERWASRITGEELAGFLDYTSMVNPQPRRYELWLAVAHFFNHQTHHRGQLTALLS